MISAKLQTGNQVTKVRLTVDEGTGDERVYEFKADGTVTKFDDGVDEQNDVHCKGKFDGDGYALANTKLSCRVELDKPEFSLGYHPVKGEVVVSGLGTFSDTAKFTLKSPKSSLADLVDKSMTAPSPAKRGNTYTVMVTEKNEGPIGAGGHWVNVYLSNGASLDSGDTKVGEKYVNYIGSGSTRVLSISVKIPNGYPLGPEHFISFVDAYNVIGESNESNNQKAKTTNITN